MVIATDPRCRFYSIWISKHSIFWFQEQTMPYGSWQARKIYLYTRKFLSPRYTRRYQWQDTSFLECKHKHMKKSGAPPEKFVVLPRLFPMNSMFHKQNWFLRVINLWFLVLSQFLETVLVPLKTVFINYY